MTAKFWQCANKEMSLKKLVSTVKVMVWKSMEADGVGELVLIEAILGHHHYSKILKSNLQLFTDRLCLGLIIQSIQPNY